LTVTVVLLAAISAVKVPSELMVAVVVESSEKVAATVFEVPSSYVAVAV
jgi:hypothetical protein